MLRRARVVCMPPCILNVGAYVGEGTMGTPMRGGLLSQIGREYTSSAGAQIGGVLEPAGALPVIIEDGVLVGGNCGVYEGTVVRERAVLAPEILRRTPVCSTWCTTGSYRREGDQPLDPARRPWSSPALAGQGGAGAAAHSPVYPVL